MQNKAKLFGLVALFLIVLLGIPLTVYFTQQEQTLTQHAELNNIGPYDSCKKLHIAWQENIGGASSCMQGQGNPGVASYGVTIFIKSNDTSSHTFHYITYRSFCASAPLNPPCTKLVGGVGKAGDMTVSSTAQAIVIPVQSSPGGTHCGTYQDDFVITAIDKDSSCHYGDPNSTIFGSKAPGGAGFCSTGKACIAPLPSPSPTISPPSISPTCIPIKITCPFGRICPPIFNCNPTPTATPSPTLVPPTDTPVPPTDTPAPTATPSATPTLPPGIPTYTPTPVPTNTPAPTATPTLPPGVPTYTPAPTVIVQNNATPKPTLLPTGPIEVVTSGIIGAIVSIAGLVLLFAL